MKATIIAITKPIREDVADMTPEQFLAFQARVSNPNNQYNDATAEKLLGYCLRNGHWSVFEMVDLTFEIHTSRAIMAQILRHWSFRFQEFSQRYAMVSEFDFSDLEMRFVADGGNRQGSSEVGPAPMGIGQEAREVCGRLAAEYVNLVQRKDVAPESARMILPLATPTRAYMKGNVRSWITYFWQRLDPHAQKEHRELALLMFAQFATHFPAIATLVRNGRMQYVTHGE